MESVAVIDAPSDFGSQVVCSIYRDIVPGRDCPPIAGQVPANVYACLNVVAFGEIRIGSPTGEPLPPLFLTGPFSAPVSTFAKPPLKSLSIVLQPWLLHDWLGLPPAKLVNAILDGREVAPLNDPPIADALRVAALGPDGLEPALRRLAAPGGPSEGQARALAQTLADTQSVSLAAAHFSISPRQFERRFASLFGLGPKTWLRLKRFEDSLTRLTSPDGSLAVAAAESGYADQAHMSRDYRRAASLTPMKTKTGIAGDIPGFWAFRPAKAGSAK